MYDRNLIAFGAFAALLLIVAGQNGNETSKRRGSCDEVNLYVAPAGAPYQKQSAAVLSSGDSICPNDYRNGFSIGCDIGSCDAEFVFFDIDGKPFHMERYPPYLIASDSGGPQGSVHAYRTSNGDFEITCKAGGIEHTLSLKIGCEKPGVGVKQDVPTASPIATSVEQTGAECQGLELYAAPAGAPYQLETAVTLSDGDIVCPDDYESGFTIGCDIGTCKSEFVYFDVNDSPYHSERYYPYVISSDSGLGEGILRPWRNQANGLIKISCLAAGVEVSVSLTVGCDSKSTVLPSYSSTPRTGAPQLAMTTQTTNTTVAPTTVKATKTVGVTTTTRTTTTTEAVKRNDAMTTTEAQTTTEATTTTKTGTTSDATIASEITTTTGAITTSEVTTTIESTSTTGVAKATDTITTTESTTTTEPRARDPAPNDDCSRTRREISQLDDTEWNQYVDALYTLRLSGQYARFVEIHAEQEFQWHRGSYFLPAHRQLLWEFEELIRSVCPTCTIPYWDWSRAPDDWERSSVWLRLGGADGGVIPNPPFRGWDASSPGGHLVERTCRYNQDTNVFGVSHGTFETRANLDVLVRNRLVEPLGFAGFAEYLEIVHGSVCYNTRNKIPPERYAQRRFCPYLLLYYLTLMSHISFSCMSTKPHNQIGGDMLNGRFSPWDPIFWLHHAFVDRTWYEWQSFGGGSQFDGSHRVLPRNPANQQVAPVSRDQVLFPDEWGRTVDQVLNGPPTTCVGYSGVGRPANSMRMVMLRSNETLGIELISSSRVLKNKLVEKEVKVAAARKKKYHAQEYKESCQKAINSRDQFYAGGEQAGFSTDLIDNNYNLKKNVDSLTLEILVEDIDYPEGVIGESVEDVSKDGEKAVDALRTEGVDVSHDAPTETVYFESLETAALFEVKH